MFCGRHAINHVLNGSKVSNDELFQICSDIEEKYVDNYMNSLTDLDLDVIIATQDLDKYRDKVLSDAQNSGLYCQQHNGNFSGFVIQEYFVRNRIPSDHYLVQNNILELVPPRDQLVLVANIPVMKNLNNLKNLLKSPNDNIRGFIVGNAVHWFAVRKRTSKEAWILVDSQKRETPEFDINDDIQIQNLSNILITNLQIANGELFVIYK
jgi:hypothetical protein